MMASKIGSTDLLTVRTYRLCATSLHQLLKAQQPHYVSTCGKDSKLNVK